MQGLLQIDDDLALVLKREGDHAAHALVVDVGVAIVVDAIASQFNGFEQKFCVV
jgi:pantothenate kinase type III